MSSDPQARLRSLPSVDRVLAELAGYPHALAVDAARRAVEDARAAVLAGEAAPDIDDVVGAARELLRDADRAGLVRVINATGVLVHTNLGRVPLGPAQLDALGAVAGYSNLEYDLVAGRRGSRYGHATRALRAATGAEAALVVNNNAAAVLVVLAAMCGGREVIISRGELIEIGGEFRIPDVLEASGARLVEVGTTNRTHLADYERAITPDTAAILKVHPSNYRVVGFTAMVPGRDIARLARGRGLCFVHDVGSGLLDGPDAPWARDEPLVSAALEDGADVVTFSGDKLLGGPQAGVIVGRAEVVARVARHPLMRAVRVDKLTLAALDATLSLYLAGRWDEIPLWAMASIPPEALEARARAIVDALAGAGAKCEAVPTSSVSGGGSAPGATIPSWGVALEHPERGADVLEAALRAADPPVIARIESDRVLCDLRTVDPDDDELLVAALRAALA